MNTRFGKAVLCFFLLAIPISSTCQSRSDGFKGKTLALYISSKNVSYTDEYYLYIVQFLKINEDRSWVGKMKTELLIRTGELLCQEIQKSTGADTVLFINADVDKGSQFLNLYDSENRVLVSKDAIKGMDHVFVIDRFEMTTRETSSVYIRSNRMISEKVDVRIGKLEISNFVAGSTNPVHQDFLCFDEQASPNISRSFDLYYERSTLGKFFSKIFSNWWALEAGAEVTCPEIIAPKNPE